MDFPTKKCDECRRIKGDTNHWHQIGVIEWDGKVWVEMGYLLGPPPTFGEAGYEIRDFCSEACMYKNVSKTLSPDKVSTEAVMTLYRIKCRLEDASRTAMLALADAEGFPLPLLNRASAVSFALLYVRLIEMGYWPRRDKTSTDEPSVPSVQSQLPPRG